MYFAPVYSIVKYFFLKVNKDCLDYFYLELWSPELFSGSWTRTGSDD